MSVNRIENNSIELREIISRDDDLVEIFIFHNGWKFILFVEDSDTIMDTKIKIQEIKGIPTDCQRLFYAGRILENGITKRL